MDLKHLIGEVIDHMRGMWRFRWQAIALSWILALGAWYFVYTMPSIYLASARVSVDTNSLQQSLTQGLTAGENLMDAVGLVSKALLTRPNLEAVARETDLYLRAESPQQLENLITALQARVRVTGGGGRDRDNIFSISYEDADRLMAQRVVSALLDTFVESSLGARGDDAHMTERALAMEIEDHEQRMEHAEAALADFKKHNLGFMPDDGSDYYTQVQAALSAVEYTANEIRLLRQVRDELSRQLQGEEPVFGLMSSTDASVINGCSRAGNIVQLQAELSALLVNFTEKHPRIVMLRETIGTLEEQCRAEQASTPRMSAVMPGVDSLNANTVYQSLRLQLSNAEVELAALQEQHRTRQQRVAQLRDDVDKIAEVEKDLKRLNRDYGVVSGRHQELLQRWESLQSKKRIDPVTDQVHFDIIEPPFAATKPVAPSRPVLLVAALVLSLGAGVALAFGLNQLRPVFFSRHAVKRMTGLPVLGSVSMIMLPGEIMARRRMTLLWAGANVGLIAMAIVVIVFAESMSTIVRDLLGGNLV